jgi:mono/diheme cytochrome c family protein
MKRRTRFVSLVLILVIVAAGIVGWRMLRRGFSAREEPSKLEATMARMMRGLATPSTAKELKNPVSASPRELRAGLEHFADHCAVCHANNGSGDTMFGRNMYPKPPDLRAAQTQQLTDGEIYYIIQNGIRLTGMPAFGQGNRTDDAGSWHLVQFIRHLPKLTAAEEEAMKKLNPVSPMESQMEDDFLSGQDSSNQTQPMKHKDKH